ncbi:MULTISPECIES: hypothetical protein [Streptomyces]|uniref:Uncharacterized protein n=1 Tax=Streptomyces venezuelae (strain ATCC 10712 / CBS 650.69 / DSM 40230 / JCM 4526 / NBRC 13096 / PD 04745) TaxID=953739 RepID=F2R1H1_STRVP|nr:hypothetical protein [Streptomyces venezuelae]APE23716.1 hypothetical protein vnz_23610 [Streptomyces venezuelae]QES01088.1 hypothetical protein DEJ43_23950 [Streptomyces venezuelae ATCC 10712]QES08182.1 hypothetical protein DEJ44_22890 [Streptomyces venezuelae]CCA58062.1 hypothetical protein SVEN_4776 [Streptomyces venezuelae ATCC 10712]
MHTPHGPGAFVAHTGTDVYGPGKVLAVDGAHRRVRFTRFVATVRAEDLRPASPAEKREIQDWLRAKRQRYGGDW